MFAICLAILYRKFSITPRGQKEMEEVRTIQFVDTETKQNAVAVIQAAKGVVGFCLSIETDGDVEVFLGIDDCRTLAAAINEALVLASST